MNLEYIRIAFYSFVVRSYAIVFTLPNGRKLCFIEHFNVTYITHDFYVIEFCNYQ